MEEKEISCFTNALQLACSEFYLEAIEEFERLLAEFPNSELVDDALYNTGLCYFQTNQFEEAIAQYQKVIDDYPQSTISELEGGNEFGKTAAKCHYSIVNACLALGDVEKARSHAAELGSYSDTYIVLDGKQQQYTELAQHALKTYAKVTGG